MAITLNTYRVPVKVGPNLGHAKLYLTAPDPDTAKAMAVIVVARAFSAIYGVSVRQVRAISATLYDSRPTSAPMILSVEIYTEADIPYQG